MRVQPRQVASSGSPLARKSHDSIDLSLREPGVNLLHSRHVFRYISRHLICNVPLREKKVAFTFDDGPNPDLTPRLLDLLDSHAARATFFLIGRNVERYPRLAAEIAARGHEIGNHTQNHLLLPVLPRT
jgi:peptidoglycan/xylan/chitin deacetylase (PgdA/CDA1 family)